MPGSIPCPAFGTCSPTTWLEDNGMLAEGDPQNLSEGGLSTLAATHQNDTSGHHLQSWPATPASPPSHPLSVYTLLSPPLISALTAS